MMQTATIAAHPNTVLAMPTVLGGIHPVSVNGKIINRSPNSSPNKLSVTKKPMIASPQNNGTRGNFTARNRVNGSPVVKYNSNGNNYISNYYSNPSQNSHPNFNANPNNRNPPLINSNGYDSKGPLLFPSNSNDRSKVCQNHPSKVSSYVVQAEDGEYGYCQKCSINLASRGITVVKREEKLGLRSNCQ
jgi:hypothetical protein